MRLRNPIVLGTCVALLAVSTGCDSGEITFVESELSETEVDHLLEMLAAVGSFDPGVSAQPPPAPPAGGAPAAQGASVPFSQSVEWAAPCPGGGTLEASGTFIGEVEAETGLDATYSAMLDYNGCMGTSDDGMEFTVDGGVTTAIDVTASEGVFSMTGNHAGSIGWTLEDGRMGNCVIALDFSSTVSQGSLSSSVSGSLCGVTVSRMVTVG